MLCINMCSTVGLWVNIREHCITTHVHQWGDDMRTLFTLSSNAKKRNIDLSLQIRSREPSVWSPLEHLIWLAMHFFKKNNNNNNIESSEKEPNKYLTNKCWSTVYNNKYLFDHHIIFSPLHINMAFIKGFYKNKMGPGKKDSPPLVFIITYSGLLLFAGVMLLARY